MRRLVLLCLLCACADPNFDEDREPTLSDDSGASDAADDSDEGLDRQEEDGGTQNNQEEPPTGYELGTPVVYAHSAQELYKIDPESLELSLLGNFNWPAAEDEMTDLAVDKDGLIIGVSRNVIYSVDDETMDCTALATIEEHLIGLSFAPHPFGEGADVLLGLTKEGTIYDISAQSGVTRLIGALGDNWQGSGDLVSVKDAGTFATVQRNDLETDWLVEIDTLTGLATPIGDTGFDKLWGLGYWRGKVFGFNDLGEFVLIDVDTGEGTLQLNNGLRWWGAGVSTIAPTLK